MASAANPETPRHSALVRVTHWLTLIAFLALLITGVEILISHPRFYWGETGNVNTAPLFTIPIPSSRDTVPTGYKTVLPDQNGWSRPRLRSRNSLERPSPQKPAARRSRRGHRLNFNPC